MLFIRDKDSKYPERKDLEETMSQKKLESWFYTHTKIYELLLDSRWRMNYTQRRVVENASSQTELGNSAIEMCQYDLVGLLGFMLQQAGWYLQVGLKLYTEHKGPIGAQAVSKNYLAEYN